MTLYVESSAFATRYLPDETHHESCVAVMQRDNLWITSRVTTLEAGRAVWRRAATHSEAISGLTLLDNDLAATALIDVDQVTLAIARDVALQTGLKSLDALQLASAVRIRSDDLEFLTYDAQQARAAQSLGLTLAV